MNAIRILIVDDLPQVRKGLADMLQLAALQTIPPLQVIGESSDGNEAIRMAGELQPDVILMDLEMPGMDGFRATQVIKSNLPTVRVVILSIHTSAEMKDRARRAGADAFVEKGNGYRVLLSAILNKNG